MGEWRNAEMIERIRAIVEADTEHFSELVALSGLEPGKSFRRKDLQGVSFAGCDLRGYDFAGARLIGCDFSDARLGRGREAARLDGAVLGIVRHRHGSWRKANPHAPGVLGPRPGDPPDVAELSRAADWEEYVRDWQPLPVADRRASSNEFFFDHSHYDHACIGGSEAPHSPDDHLPPGAIFQDAPFAPQMVVLPAGSFMMGSPDGSGGDQGDVAEEERFEDEGPRHQRVIDTRFALGRTPVTFADWDAARARGADLPKLDDEGWGRGARPVINVSWNEATAYCKWLSAESGRAYRLPTEAEWEYACRAGTETRYWFGEDERELSRHAWSVHNSHGKSQPVCRKPANPWGLSDMHGNVWEWCFDPWQERYGDDQDGDADPSSRVLRGGSWRDDSQILRSSIRARDLPVARVFDLGFRLARTL